MPALGQGQTQTEAPLRVAYLLQRFPVLSETFILRELAALVEQGMEVTIFSLLPPKEPVRHAQADLLLPYTRYASPWSLPVLRAQAHFLRRRPLRYLRAWANAIHQCYREPLLLARVLVLLPVAVYFAQQMEAARIQHIHSHYIWLGAILAGVAGELIDVRYSAHVHAFDLYQRDVQDVRRQLADAAQIVTISEANRRYIYRLCPELDDGSARVEVVYCGVDSTRLSPRPAHLADGPATPLRLVTVGRLIEKKGHTVLVEACRGLRDEGIEFICHIIGDGPLRPRLQAQVAAARLADQVVFCGPMAQDAVFAQLRQSDVFVLPALQARSGDRDGIPVVLMEAMACELPVVTTPISGIPELVTHGESGLLVEADAAGNLAANLVAALRRLAAAPSLRQELGQAGRRKVMADFDLYKNTQQLAGIFRRVAAPPAQAVEVGGVERWRAFAP